MKRILLVLALLVLPSPHAWAAPVTISNVVVTMGGLTFDSAFVGWQLPVTLNAGENLILAQNWTGTPNDQAYCATCSYNFDGSEYAGFTPVIRFDLDGVTHTFTDDLGTLTAHTKENGNESLDWFPGIQIDNVRVRLAYADNTHPGECDTPTCFPSGFFTPTYLQYAPGYQSFGVPDGQGRCVFGASDPFCADSSVIEFTNTDVGRSVDPNPVPEPASLGLLGIGLLFIAWRGRRMIATKALVLLVACAGLANAQPVTISHVSVMVGSRTFDAQSVGWQFPVTLTAGQSLVLAQNAHGAADDTRSYNFALADYVEMPVVLIGANRWHIIYDSRQTLTARSREGGNKATDWEIAMAEGNMEVWFGYADNLHAAPCLIARCVPTDFFSSTYFQGAYGYAPPSLDFRAWDHCGYGAATCLNSAAIRIVNTDVPDPPTPPEHSSASLLCLFGASLVGIAANVRRR